MSTNVSPDFPSLQELLKLVTSTLDTIKDAIKRLSKGGVSRDQEVLASLPPQLPILLILSHLEAIQQETSKYYITKENNSTEERESQGVPDALGLRDRQVVVQAIDLLVLFEVAPRLAPGIGISLDKRMNLEGAQVLQALRTLVRSQYGVPWAQPSEDIDLEQIALRLTSIVALRKRGDVASVLTEKYTADLLATLLQLSFAPIPPDYQSDVFLMREKYMVVANQDRRIELRKRFTRIYDSLNPYLLLETLTNLINAAAGQNGSNRWFCILCGRFLTRVLLRPDGVRITIDFIVGNEEGSLSAEKLERVAKLLLSPPAGMESNEYYAKVIPQITRIIAPLHRTSDTARNNSSPDDDARQMVDYVVDKAASQERMTHAAVYTLQRLANMDTTAFTKHTSEVLHLPIQRWFSEKEETIQVLDKDLVSRGLLESSKPKSAKIQIIGASPADSDLSLHNEDSSTISAATELNRALLGIQQLILAYSFPESRLLLEKLVLPIFVPLVHWYAAEVKAKENTTIAESDESPSISDILREIVTTTLASMPHSASVAMMIELIQYARGSSRIGTESGGGSGDWPVFATHNGVTKLVWHSDVPELDQSHVPVDALLDILADSKLREFVGDLFVTLLREQEALMELVRSASGDTSDNGGISGLTHKWWLVSQTTMSIIERFGPSVLSRRSDVLAFILNVLDRYTDDTIASNVEDNSTGDERPTMTEKGTIESLMQTLEMDDEPDVEGKVGGTEIVLLALMLLGQLMSASEEKAFSGESGGFDTQSLKLLRTIHRQIKQIGANSKTVASVTQIARAVQMQVALVLALQGATGGDGKVDSDGVLGDTEVARFNAALRDVRNEDLVPVQAHGIIELRSLVLAKSNVVLGNTERLDAVIGVFVDKIKSADSFVYLNAVRGLSALADAHGQRFVPKLIELYCAKDSGLTLDEQLRVGEALLQSIQRAGDTLPVYAPLLVPRLLAIVQNTDATQGESSEFSAVRAHSALSILATVAQTSALALNRWMDLIAATVDGILIAESSAVELRRAAIVFWISLLRGFGTRLVDMVDMDILRLMHRTLRRVSSSDDEDELTRMHAQVGVEELDDVVKTTLFLP